MRKLLVYLWSGKLPVEFAGLMVSGASSSGSGVFDSSADRTWGHLDDAGGNRVVGSCLGFCSVPSPLQRAEFWGVIFALQAADGIHLGVDNLGVVRHVGRLLDGGGGSRPAALVKDGDFILLIGRMLRLRGLGTVRITKLKCHADEGVVRDGGVRELDRLGNDAADEAADFGRRRVDFPVIHARRNLSGVLVAGTLLVCWCSSEKTQGSACCS